MNFLELYITYIKKYFKSRAEYRVSFYTGILSNLYCYLILYISIWITLGKVESINGWNFSEISFLYSLNLLTYSISGVLIWYSTYFMEDMILTGEIDRFFLRPYGMVRQLICYKFGSTFIGQIIISGLFLSYSLSQLKTPIHLEFVVMIILSIIGGVIIHISALLFIGSLSFIFLKTKQLSSLAYYELREFTYYPLSVYPDGVKWLLTFVLPWGLINYYPSLVLLNKTSDGFDHFLGILSPIISIFIFWMSRKFLYFSMKQYTGVGN